MNWNNFNSYGDSQEKNFETLCNQLFERFLRRTYKDRLVKFRVINGAGGDGGVESYGMINTGNIIAIQAKWFRNVLKAPEISQIKNSIVTAKELRPEIKEYVICIPHDVSSLKYGRGSKEEGKKPIKNYEEKTIDGFTDKIHKIYPDLKLTWWFEKDIEHEIQQVDNEGIHKYWFEKEVISFSYLRNLFKIQKKGWLNERYVPELHGQGVIHREYTKICFKKEFREDLKSIIHKEWKDIENCIFSISDFLKVNQKDVHINTVLENVKTELLDYKDELLKLDHELENGNDQYLPNLKTNLNIRELIRSLAEIRPDNTQKSKLPGLISTLERLYNNETLKVINRINLMIKQKVKLILGEPGTGKTHGLANCIELHLKENSPALIIQAKGTSCKNWTKILCESLELHDWNKSEVFSALESLAFKEDINNFSSIDQNKEQKQELTKVLICIDGLEEDYENNNNWYERFRECETLIKEYPRIRFIFSARRYFYDEKRTSASEIYDYVFLPREGDVSIEKISKRYFSEEHYNIKIPSFSMIKGIDSLFALRLFCEHYKDKQLSDSDKIFTATNDLLNIKIAKVNEEFLSSLKSKRSTTRTPLLDALISISEYFYKNVEAEHTQLVDVVRPHVYHYLETSEVDLLIDFLVDHGFLVKYESEEKVGILKRSVLHYSVAYQSITEYIISQKAYMDISSGQINKIPDIFYLRNKNKVTSSKTSKLASKFKSNQRIIQNIVDSLFLKDGKLIGDEGFLIEGFEGTDIFVMQMEALRKAPKELAIKYKERVDKMIFGGPEDQYKVFKHLILPSCYSNENSFGSEYLHEALFNKDSAFERDKLWSGLDKYELSNLSQSGKEAYQQENITTVLQDFNIEIGLLFETQKHDEIPLLYAWGLSSINQYLRNSLRVALCDWACKSPEEYVLLLEKVFFCNDPQIQEDLASIMLGVSSLLNDKSKVAILAKWALENVFFDLEANRNVIVRQGFRAIVERAFQYGVITKAEAETARPKLFENPKLLPLDEKYLKQKELSEEYYPIVHDLAWYVFKKAYEDFFEYSSMHDGEMKDNNCKEAISLLNTYNSNLNKRQLFGSSLAMSAALLYIRTLGLTRETGNWTTEATHGSKSKLFTYEEKYTWLAVHFLQGYFSDYIPIKLWSGEREAINDYSLLTEIPNPAEFLPGNINNTETKSGEWIIKEFLSKELDETEDIKKTVFNWVEEEPNLNFTNWICYNSAEFNTLGKNKSFLALFNHTGLCDSSDTCYSYIDLRACLIKKDDFIGLRKTIDYYSDGLHFLNHIDGMKAIPKTHTYCNPSDIVWMEWIEEEEKLSYFYFDNKKVELLHSVTRVVQNTIDGEKYRMLPSKKVRELMGIVRLVKSELKNAEDETLAYLHQVITDSYQENQEIVVVDSDTLLNSIKKTGYKVVWFVELFKRTNHSNETLPKGLNFQKTRKYFVWEEKGEFKSIKFWDERFSNKRDRVKRDQ